MDKKVLVIGGGVAGMAAALELAEQGVEVYVVEKTGAIGGKGVNYCCKAAPGCSKCGACLPLQLKRKVEGQLGIKLIFNSEVKGLEEEAGKFNANIRFLTGSRGVDLGAETVLQVNGVVVALGFEIFDAASKGEFGYGVHKNVITAYDLEKALQETGSVEAAFGPGITRVGFIQCVGSRDVQAGSNYCSRVCCMYASKLAKLVRNELPQAKVDIFYLDIQTYGKDFACFLQECREKDRINYVRAIPSKIYRYPYDYLSVQYAGSSGQQVEPYDLMILAPAITPARGLAQFAQHAGLNLDRHGFLTEAGRPGVVAAGTCTGPMDIPQTAAHAQAAAARVMQHLK